MKRSHGPVPLVPLDGAPAARKSFVNLQPGTPRPRNSFEVKNAAADDEEGDPTVAEIYLYAEIGESWWGDSITANDFVKALRELGDGIEQINLHINSPGGSIFDGVAIYNALLQHKAHVTVYVDSLAASAASFIAQAGDEIIMARASTMMIHDGWGFAMGNADDMLAMADILDKLSNNIASIYAARTGEPTEDWRDVMRAEAWYTAEEAVSAGLADKVWSEPVSVENRWDLSVFNFAGRESAPSPDLIRQSALLNRMQNKENPVANRVINKVKNSEEPVVPEAPAEESVEEVVEEPVVPEVPAEEPEAPTEEPVVPEEPEPAASLGPQARATLSVLVNGSATSDVNAIQAHINVLETFARESRDKARTDFVAALANEGKIVAPMAEPMTAMVLKMDNEQFEGFKNTYASAPKLPLLARHGAQASEAQTTAEKARADRIEVLQGIIEHHRNSGMKEEDIASMGSFAELKVLLEMNSGQTS